MRSNAKGAIKKQVQLHDGLFHVIYVARVQTTNWALSCKMQVLPVGFLLLAQRDQRDPSSEEDNSHKTCTETRESVVKSAVCMEAQ